MLCILNLIVNLYLQPVHIMLMYAKLHIIYNSMYISIDRYP